MTMRNNRLKRQWNQLDSVQKRELMQEARQRVAVRHLIKEEMLMIEQHKRTCDLIIREEKRMRRAGYAQDEINEGIMDLIGKIPGSYITYLKQYFIGMALDKLGFDQDSVLGYALKNTLENMEFTNITKYFGEGGCEPLVDLILQSLGEALAEKGLDKIAEALFGRKAEGFISGTGREMLMNAIRDMTKNMRDPITQSICGANFSELASGLKNIFSLGGGGSSAPNTGPMPSV